MFLSPDVYADLRSSRYVPRHVLGKNRSNRETDPNYQTNQMGLHNLAGF
jgi:hypothetical protein